MSLSMGGFLPGLLTSPAIADRIRKTQGNPSNWLAALQANGKGFVMPESTKTPMSALALFNQSPVGQVRRIAKKSSFNLAPSQGSNAQVHALQSPTPSAALLRQFSMAMPSSALAGKGFSDLLEAVKKISKDDNSDQSQTVGFMGALKDHDAISKIMGHAIL